MKDNKYFLGIKGNKIFYRLIKTKRKTVGITIDEKGEVKVSVPLYIDEEKIREIVQQKAPWIEKKINEIQSMNLNTVHREFTDGESLFYLGKEYVFKIIKEDLNVPKVIINGNIIEMYISENLLKENSKQVIKEILIKWYRQNFAEIVKDRIEKYSLLLKVKYKKIKIKDQKTLWGSCSTKENINLNWRLIMAPFPIIDYVVVHELCHLRFMNHSKDFWALVESVMPDYPERREWLKVNGYKLTL
ncbi:MAG: M48 family metallopeptidase [Tissierellaceae bacterium]|nr:M48 family metallopeptidase [Tissierellaceae bacterium]